MSSKPAEWQVPYNETHHVIARFARSGVSLKARIANGIIAALITVIFLVHGIMGSLWATLGFSSSLSWVVWGALIVVGLHVVMSVVTSSQQLNDAERPPSRRKKAHLALKWVTGGLLAVVALVHIVLPKSLDASAFVIVAVSIALAAHLCTCAKSLLSDLAIDRRWKWPFRVFVCLCALLFSLVMLKGVL